jgi:hypothetical protein
MATAFRNAKKHRKVIYYSKNMPTRSNSGLMYIDKPRRLLESLCLLRDETFTAEDYRPVLSLLTGDSEVHEKILVAYFYTAAIFNLIKPTSRGSHKYLITPVCREICRVLKDESMKQTYQKYLRVLLLSNPIKGQFFKRFLQYTSKPRRRKEITAEFGNYFAATLISFSIEAGMLVCCEGFFKSVEVKSSVSVKEFYSSLSKIYYNLKESSERNTQLIYVPIDIIRDMVCLDLGLESHGLFNTLLSKTLESSFGLSIYLHGAPPQAEDEFVGLDYGGRRYAYISIR